MTQLNGSIKNTPIDWSIFYVQIIRFITLFTLLRKRI